MPNSTSQSDAAIAALTTSQCLLQCLVAHEAGYARDAGVPAVAKHADTQHVGWNGLQRACPGNMCIRLRLNCDSRQYEAAKSRCRTRSSTLQCHPRP